MILLAAAYLVIQGLASPALNSMTCRRPDAAAQMNTSNDTDAILEEHIHSSIADDWTGTATGEIGTVLSEWDVAHWLQDLTDLKDEFGSQEQVSERRYLAFPKSLRLTDMHSMR